MVMRAMLLSVRSTVVRVLVASPCGKADNPDPTHDNCSEFGHMQFSGQSAVAMATKMKNT